MRYWDLKDARELAERCRKFGDVTKNGMTYHWELAGPNGASFVLFREKHHTIEDIKMAKAQLRFDHDVVGSIGIETI